MKITFIGATHEVTGSCSLLEVGGKQILVDCGMEQGADIFENIEIPVAPSDIDAIVLTHAHIDHTGKVPFLVSKGYSGPIYSTEATRQLCSIMLMDSAHIQEFEAEWRNRKGQRAGNEEYVPLYTSEDVLATMKLFRTAGYGTDVDIFDGVTINYTDAGHILGSASVLFKMKEGDVEKTLLFSGDLGNKNKPLMRDPQTPPPSDYTIIESTYGDRLHAAQPDYIHDLTSVIQRTLDRGGNVVIPAFAVGRTQELLYYLRIIKEEGLVKNHDGFPVIIDSPLAVNATAIYSDSTEEYYDEDACEILNKGINPITFSDLRYAVTSDESKAINSDNTPKVIISASGMCEAGRIRHHLKHNLWRPECTILFVGFQSRGTIGDKLLAGAGYVRLFNEDIQVNAEVTRIDSFSSHADSRMLLEWLRKAPPKQLLFVNHGEDKVTESFAEDATEFLGIPAEAPYSGDVWDLATCTHVHKAEIIPVIRKEAHGGVETSPAGERLLNSERKYPDSPAYRELQKTVARLNSLVEDKQGGSNKELKKLTRELNELISKYSDQNS